MYLLRMMLGGVKLHEQPVAPRCGKTILWRWKAEYIGVRTRDKRAHVLDHQADKHLIELKKQAGFVELLRGPQAR